MSSNATETAVGAAVLAVAIGFVLYAGQAIGSFEPIRTEWLEYAEALGEIVSVSTGQGEVSGKFETLAPDGAMVLRLPNGGQTLIRAGDVQIRQGDGHAAGD